MFLAFLVWALLLCPCPWSASSDDSPGSVCWSIPYTTAAHLQASCHWMHTQRRWISHQVARSVLCGILRCSVALPISLSPASQILETTSWLLKKHKLVSLSSLFSQGNKLFLNNCPPSLLSHYMLAVLGIKKMSLPGKHPALYISVTRYPAESTHAEFRNSIGDLIFFQATASLNMIMEGQFGKESVWQDKANVALVNHVYH